VPLLARRTHKCRDAEHTYVENTFYPLVDCGMWSKVFPIPSEPDRPDRHAEHLYRGSAQNFLMKPKVAQKAIPLETPVSLDFVESNQIIDTHKGCKVFLDSSSPGLWVCLHYMPFVKESVVNWYSIQ
jgi:hypothetical protein